MNQERILEHIRVLVTRPAHQSMALCDAFTELGARVLRLPAIEIRALVPSTESGALNTESTGWIKHLSDFDFAIFISPNAVEYGMALILAQGNIPDKLKLVTIGRTSADTLFQCSGRKADIFPLKEFNSEALLALKSMSTASVKGKKILIFRGQGGREYLADNLRQRGAIVEYAEVYRRCLPQVDEKTLEQIWAADTPHIVTVTSAAGLTNLLQLCSVRYQELLRNTPLVVVTQNMLPIARELGFRNDIIVASQASDKALIDGVIQWRRSSMDIRDTYLK